MKQLHENLRSRTTNQSSDTQDGDSIYKYFVQNPPIHPLRMSSSGNDDIVKHLKNHLNDQQLAMFSNTCFGIYLNIPTCTFQAQMARCFMTREVKQDNKDEFWILVNGTVLRFTILEFALITGLKCTGSEEDFDFTNAPTNRLIDDYFNSITPVRKSHLIQCFEQKRWGNNTEDAVKIAILYFIHTFLFSQLTDVVIPDRDFHLVDSGRYNQFPWGKLSFQAFIKSYRQTMNFTKKLYRLCGMPYALQVWFYECCSQVQASIAIHEADLIPRILNWCVVDPQPNFSILMQDMFSNEGNKMSYRNITPTANELAVLDLPRTIDPACEEYTTSRILDEFEDFSSTPLVNLYKRAIRESGPSTEPPTRKQKTYPVPPKLRTRHPRIHKSAPLKAKAKHPAHYPRPTSEHQNLKQKETVDSSYHAHPKRPVDTEQHQPVKVDIQRGDAKTTNEETTSKQDEEDSQLDLKSFKKSVDKHFLDLYAYMDSQFSAIIEAIKKKSLSDSKVEDIQADENMNEGANQGEFEMVEWKNSKASVGGDSSDDHSEKDDAARIKAQLQHTQSPGIDVQSPALKKSQCSAQLLEKTEAEVHKLLMMPLNKVVLPKNQSTLITALPRYAASPHFSVEKARAVEELKKNLPSLFFDFQQMKKQQEECNSKADKKMFLTDHLTKRRELYDGLEHNSSEIDNSIYSIKSKIAELQAFLEEATTKQRANEELKVNCQKQYSAILAELEEMGAESLDSEKELADSHITRAESSWIEYKQKIIGLRM